MLTREQAFNIILSDDQWMRKAISIDGLAIFLLACLESVVARSHLPDQEYSHCFKFVLDCIKLVERQSVSVETFEGYVAPCASSYGFEANAAVYPESRDFWLYMMTTCGWFAVLAAERNQEFSFFREAIEADSICRIFYSLSPSTELFDWRFCADCLRFVVSRFPSGSTITSNLNYGSERQLLLEFLATGALQ